MDEPDEQVLLAGIKRRDQAAFNQLYQTYWRPLYAVAYKIVLSEESAKDVVQDVFVSIWEKASSITILKLEAYLFQAVKLQCFMVLRAGAITRKHLQRFNQVLYQHIAVEDVHDYKELQDLLERSIASLPDRCREVFYLSRMESLPNKQIAEQLNISPKTVENHITKALRVLREAIDRGMVLFL